MLSISFISRSSALVVFTGVLSACTSVTPVKEVTSDSAAYLSKKFSVASLSPSIAKKVPIDTIPPGQEGISLVTVSNYESSDGKKGSWKNVITLTNLGHGLFQKTVEKSNNDIPYEAHYSLTYRGIMDLRWQAVRLSGTMTDPLYEVKEVTRFDVLPTTPNLEFSVEFSSGNEVQLGNYLSAKKLCKATRLIAAGDIHKKLVGTGLEFECDQVTNNSVQSRTKWAFLQSYGVAIQTESTGSAYKTLIQVVDVNG